MIIKRTVLLLCFTYNTKLKTTQNLFSFLQHFVLIEVIVVLTNYCLLFNYNFFMFLQYICIIFYYMFYAVIIFVCNNYILENYTELVSIIFSLYLLIFCVILQFMYFSITTLLLIFQ